MRRADLERRLADLEGVVDGQALCNATARVLAGDDELSDLPRPLAETALRLARDLRTIDALDGYLTNTNNEGD